MAALVSAPGLSPWAGGRLWADLGGAMAPGPAWRGLYALLMGTRGPSSPGQGCACGGSREGFASQLSQPGSLASSNKGMVAFHAAFDLRASSKALPAGPWAPFAPLSSCSNAGNPAGSATCGDGDVEHKGPGGAVPGAGPPCCLHVLVFGLRGGEQGPAQCGQMAQGAFALVFASQLNNSHG